jgi:hypothetical protein
MAFLIILCKHIKNYKFLPDLQVKQFVFNFPLHVKHCSSQNSHVYVKTLIYLSDGQILTHY